MMNSGGAAGVTRQSRLEPLGGRRLSHWHGASYRLCRSSFPIIDKVDTFTSNLSASKYLKNEKEVFFSENPYVLYTKDIIFPQTA